MTEKSELICPQGLCLGARAPTCPLPLLRHCLHPQHSLTFNIVDLKFRDLRNCVFKLIMTKSIFKNNSYDVISVTSSPLRHQNNVTYFFNLPPLQSKFLATPVFVFYDAINITSTKIRLQNDVTKIFHFQDPLLAKFWLPPVIAVMIQQ